MSVEAPQDLTEIDWQYSDVRTLSEMGSSLLCGTDILLKAYFRRDGRPRIRIGHDSADRVVRREEARTYTPQSSPQGQFTSTEVTLGINTADAWIGDRMYIHMVRSDKRGATVTLRLEANHPLQPVEVEIDRNTSQETYLTDLNKSN